MFSTPPTLTELPLERLEHEIVQLAAHANAGLCRWLELVAELDRRQGWASWGCRSAAEWVAWRCALEPRTAREHVRVARALAELPAIGAAFATGRLSYAKVRALTRIATPEREDELLELAEHATASQLERIVRGLRRVSRADAAAAQESRYLSAWWEDDGSLSLRGNLPPEEGARLLRGLDAMHDALRECGEGRLDAEASGHAEPAWRGSAEPREPRRTTNADALVAMADTAIEGLDAAGAGAGAPRYEVAVHVEAATLASDAPGSCRIAGGSALSAETARRLSCDAAIVAVTQADGTTLSVGRRTRAIPTALGRAVRARDGTCTFPGCDNRRFLDGHHIHHWARGGTTDLDNLTLLCRGHHRLVHEGGFSLRRGDDGQIVVCDPRGRRLRASPPLPEARPDGLADRTCAQAPASGTGERLDDLDHAIWVLAARGNP